MYGLGWRALPGHVQDTQRDALAGGAQSTDASMRLAELHDSVTKLRGHLSKYDKRISGSDAALQLLSSRMDETLLRVAAVESQQAQASLLFCLHISQ